MAVLEENIYITSNGEEWLESELASEAEANDVTLEALIGANDLTLKEEVEDVETEELYINSKGEEWSVDELTSAAEDNNVSLDDLLTANDLTLKGGKKVIEEEEEEIQIAETVPTIDADIQTLDDFEKIYEETMSDSWFGGVGSVEGELVPFLEENFSKYGLTFEESGIGDYVTVKSTDPSKKGSYFEIKEFSVGNYGSIDKEGLAQLKDWMKNAALDTSQEEEKAGVSSSTVANVSNNIKKRDGLEYADEIEKTDPKLAKALRDNEELFPAAEALREDLENIDQNSSIYKEGLLSKLLWNDVPAGQPYTGEITNITNRTGGDLSIVESVKTPDEQFKYYITLEEKPNFMSQDQWDLLQNYKQTGELSEESLSQLPQRIKDEALYSVKQKFVNKRFHELEYEKDERVIMTGLMSDQLKGKLTSKDVQLMADDPELLKIELEKNNIRNNNLVKQADELKASQEELENNTQYKNLNKRAEDASKSIAKMTKDGINADSSPEDIVKYNKLVNEIKTIQAEFSAAGFDEQIAQHTTRVENWNKKRTALLDDASELGDIGMTLDLATKDYSALNRTALQLETFFLGSGSGFLGTAAGYLADLTEFTLGSSPVLTNALRDFKGATIDYNETLKNRLNEDFATPLKFDEVSWDTIDSYVANSLADGAPSIATIFLTRGMGKMRGRFQGVTNASIANATKLGNTTLANSLKAQQIANMTKASRLAAQTFFVTSAGSKGMELEIAQKNAPKEIALITEKLASGELTPYETVEARKQLENLNKALDLTSIQKATSQLLSGSIEMYSEKLGTLGYMNNLNRIKHAVGASTFKKMMYAGLNATVNVGTELVEETAAQIGNNVSDILILKEDKSMFEGLDADFFTNVAITSLAIQGPSIGSGLYNIIASEARTRDEILQNQNNLERLLEIENTLSNPTNLTPDQIAELTGEKITIMEDAALASVMSFDKLTQLSEQEKRDLFDINRQRRKVLEQFRELGGRGDAGSKSVKNQKANLQKEFDRLDNQRNKLLSQPEVNRRKIYEKAVDPALGAYNQGLYDFYSNIVGVQQAMNGNRMINVNEDTTIEELTELYGKETAIDLLAGRDAGNNATFVGDDIILFDSNISQNLMVTINKTEALFAAVSPLHELMHIQNRKAGIVKDEVLVDQANEAVKEAEAILKTKLATGKITQKQYNEYLQRKEMYTTKDGIDVEEHLQIFGDLVAAGILSQYDFNNISALKYMLKGLINKYNPSNTTFLFPIKTGNDVFSYIKSFHKSVEESKANMQPAEEKKEEARKMSKAATEDLKVIFDKITGPAENLKFTSKEEFRKSPEFFDGLLEIEQANTLDGSIANTVSSAYLDMNPKFIEEVKRRISDKYQSEFDASKNSLFGWLLGKNAIVNFAAGDIQNINKKKPQTVSASKKVGGEGSKKTVVDKFVSKEMSPEDATDLALMKDRLKKIKPQTSKIAKKLGLTSAQENLVKRDIINYLRSPKRPSMDSPKKFFKGFVDYMSATTGARLYDLMPNKKGMKAFLETFAEDLIALNKVDPAVMRRSNWDIFYEMEIESMDTGETQKAIDEGRIPESTSLTAGNTLWKTLNPTPAKVVEYLMNIRQDQLKRKLPKFFAEVLGKNEFNDIVDNPVQPVYTPEGKVKKGEKIDLSESITTEEAKVGKPKVKDIIARPGGLKFSKGQSLKEQKLKPKEFIERYDDVVSWFMADVSVVEAAEIMAQVIEQETTGKYRNIPVEEIIALVAKNLATNKGIAYEHIVDDKVRKAIKQGKGTAIEGLKILNLGPTEEGGAADFSGEIWGQPFSVEIKLDKAQYSSITLAFNFKTGIGEIKGYKGAFSDQVMEVFKSTIKDLNAYNKAHKAETGRELTHTGTAGGSIDQDVWKKLKDKGYNKDISKEFIVDQALMEELYLKKKPPVTYIQIKGHGLFYLGENGNTLNLPIPRLECKMKVKLRVAKGRNSVGQATLGLRVIPFELIDFKAESDISLDNISKINKLMNSDAVKDILKEQQKNGITKSNKKTETDSKVGKPSKSSTNAETLRELGILDKALEIARDPNAPVKKIRVFDFDDTLAQTKSNVLYTMPDGKTGKITPAEFAKKGAQMEVEGATWDFSEFKKVVDGKKGPLFIVAEKIQKARGTEDVFVLTARPQEAAGPISEFLNSLGLNIPIDNITGLADSSPLAKSGWIVNKAAEGYNDFYFADDHVANVDAVKKALDVLPVKGKTQQAKILRKSKLKFSKGPVKRVLDVVDVKGKVQQNKLKFSKSIDEKFNEFIEDKTGIDSFKEFSSAQAKLRGQKKGRFKFFVPPSADDFVGLLYHLLSRGKKGDAQMAWFKKHLLDPYARAMADITRDRVQMMADFKALKDTLKNIPKNLRKEAFDGYTYENVVRIYAWNKQGSNIPGLSKADLAKIEAFVAKNPELQVFADQLINITKSGEYSTPTASWLSGTITTDLISVLNNNKRKLYLKQWQDNIDLIFSDKNLNKLEAAFGTNYREALENMISRMESGNNKSTRGSDRLANKFLDYVNNSVGTVMFFNMRSALLQLISSVNFINWSDNNIVAAGKAFANQPQYWKDFMTLMNSEFLVDRRNGLKINVSESEIADAAATSRNKAKGVIAYILKKGFLPTQFADSFAIASGGATFYRNKVNRYIKEGMSQKEAEAKAFNDFREIAEESQQSSRPDRISQQQSSALGRIILAFANTPMQYTRLIKKASLDLINGRGDWKSNVSKIVYYAAVQNVIFNALQQAIFALAWGDDDEEDDEAKKEKMYSIANGMLDSILRGTGIAGGIVSVVKNIAIEIYDRSGRKRPEYAMVALRLLDISPPIDIKVSKLRQAANNYEYNKDLIATKGFAIDNPAWLSAGLVLSSTLNIPLDRLILKMNNVKFALDSDEETWKRIAAALGYPEWQLKSAGELESYKQLRKQEKKIHKSLGKWEVIDGDEIESLSKNDQVDILTKIGLSKDEIKDLKYEEDRVNRILTEYEKDNKKVTKILDKHRPAKELSPKMKKQWAYSEEDKIKVLKNWGYTDEEIAKMTTPEAKIKAILKRENEENYIKFPDSPAISPVVEEEKEEEKKVEKKTERKKILKDDRTTAQTRLYKLRKADQVDTLTSLGLSDAQIKALKYEEDRVREIERLYEEKNN